MEGVENLCEGIEVKFRIGCLREMIGALCRDSRGNSEANSERKTFRRTAGKARAAELAQMDTIVSPSVELKTVKKGPVVVIAWTVGWAGVKPRREKIPITCLRHLSSRVNVDKVYTYSWHGELNKSNG